MIPVHPKVCWDYKVVDQKLFFLGKILNAIKVKVGIAVRMPIKTWKKLTLYPWILSLQNFLFVYHYAGFPGSSNGKESACSAGDPCLIPGSGRSPREGNGNPLQYSCLGISRTEKPGRLQSMGSQRVGHDWATPQNRTEWWTMLRIFVRSFFLLNSE